MATVMTCDRYDKVAKDIKKVLIKHNCTVGEARVILLQFPEEFDNVLIREVEVCEK